MNGQVIPDETISVCSILAWITCGRSHSTSRLSDIPPGNGFSFNSSATDLSRPQLINTIPLPSGSPKGKSPALLTAATRSKGPLYLLNSNSTPGKCTDPI
jgi:hypothetical protein